MNHEHLSRTDIEQVLPHRRPFMFLESVDVLEPGKHAVGILTDLRDPDFDFLKGHFPDFRVVPGIIIMEALAELLDVAAASGFSEGDNKIGVLVEDRMRYRQMVKPGDSIRLEAEVTNMRRNIGRGNVKALLGDKVAAEGEITFALIDKADLTIQSSVRIPLGFYVMGLNLRNFPQFFEARISSPIKNNSVSR